MKKKFRSLVALILAFIMAVPMVVLGANELTESTARVFVDGAEVSTSTSLGGGIGRKPAFTVEGRTFLAARAMGVAFSRDIMWQPHSNTLYFGQVPAHSYLVTVTTPGGQQTISIDQIHALGMTNVDAISNNNPINFGAVSFASLFEAMNINVSNAQNFIFVGLDSFYNWATAEDVLNAENGWLALYENGTRLGTRTRVVLAADGAPGRWVRDIKEIIVVEGDIYEMWNREINIVADGVTVDKTNGGMPFMHRGKIYMPLRAVAEALGFPVGWNGAENAITIGTTDIASQVVGGGELAINAGGVQLIVTMDDVLEIGLEDFYAVIRGERRDYSGVSIARIMDFLNLDASSATGMVTFDTRDGAGTQGTVLEVFDPTNGFIAIAEGGVPLGHWEAGGRGPFMLVFAQDQFAQRFMRYLTVINIDMPAPAVRAFNDHPIIINGQTFTANDLYALGATDLEWNNQNFIALPVTALNLGNITGGRIVADNESYRDLDAAAAASLYIAIYRAGHEPQTDNHFTAVVTIDTNNQRRLGGLAIVELEIGDARTFNNHPLTINGQTFTANDIYALGATNLEWNNQNFIAVPVSRIISGNFTSGRIVADNDTTHELSAADISVMYIAFYQEGHTPATDNHFITVFTTDTNNQRRMRGLATVELATEGGENGVDGIEIIAGERTYFVTYEAIRAFEPQNIDVVFRGISRNFTGVSAITVFESLGINLDGFTRGVVTGAATGFTQPFTIDELLDPTHFHFGFAEEGETLDNIMTVFALDDRPTRGVRGVSTIRLLDGEDDAAVAVDGLSDDEFVIIRGADSWTVTMDDLIAIGLEDFVTNIPTGGGSTRYFTGVRLTSILVSHEISIEGAAAFITTSHGSTFSAGWNIAADLDYIWIAVAENGEVLSPHNGPFFGIGQHRGGNFNPRNLASITIN